MTQSTEDNKMINNILNSKSTHDNLSKDLLISYLTRKLEDNPIDNYNEWTRAWSKGRLNAFSELLRLLKD